MRHGEFRVFAIVLHTQPAPAPASQIRKKMAPAPKIWEPSAPTPAPAPPDLQRIWIRLHSIGSGAVPESCAFMIVNCE